MPSLKGQVTYLSVKGNGQNSAMIEFSLTPDVGAATTYIVTAYPAFEPQVFAGMSALLAAAYFAKKKVAIEYYEVPTETPRCTSVELSMDPPKRKTGRK